MCTHVYIYPADQISVTSAGRFKLMKIELRLKLTNYDKSIIKIRSERCVQNDSKIIIFS
jgi:hypothetical protein